MAANPPLLIDSSNIPGLTVRLKNGSDYIMYTPTLKGLEFHKNETKKLLAMGNRGGGKSIILRFDAHMRALSCPGSTLVLVRSTYKDLLKNNIPMDLAYLLTQEFHRQWWVMMLPKKPEGGKGV